MKECHEVLQQKETEVAHVRLEIESLKIVASLLDELPLKNPYEILPRKEADLARVRHEIESLKVVAPLLSEESAFDKLSKKPPGSAEETLDLSHSSEATGTGDLFSSVMPAQRAGFWKLLKRKM
jgi:hypothetical protein